MEKVKRYVKKVLETKVGPGSPLRVAAVDNILSEEYGFFGAFPHSVFKIAKKIWRAESEQEIETLIIQMLKEIKDPKQIGLPDDYLAVYIFPKIRRIIRTKKQLISNIIYYSENMYSKNDLKGYSKKTLKAMEERAKKRMEDKDV